MNGLIVQVDKAAWLTITAESPELAADVRGLVELGESPQAIGAFVRELPAVPPFLASLVECAAAYLATLRPRFPLGKLVATPGARDLGLDFRPYLARHVAGDWGDVSEEDAAENEFSVSRPLRILSAYNTPAGRIWVITEADRSLTTVLLPSEY